MGNQLKSIFLKPSKERAVLNRHPWIFSGAVGRIDDSITPGDAVVVKDNKGADLALGHWCSDDGLVCRIVSFDPHESINADFWRSRFIKAKKLRDVLAFPSNHTTGFRFLHGEGDGLSGLVCDIFSDTASIISTNPGLRECIAVLRDFLVATYGIKNIYVTDTENHQGRWILGQKESSVFLENGLRFNAQVEGGQKTGYFLDQRINRQLVQTYAKNRTVLDAFCYSGGFSIYALAGGANAVTSIDISDHAIALCKDNVQENGFHAAHTPLAVDSFNYLRTIARGQFDMVILDPPAFAKSAHAVDRAARGYKDINLLAMKFIADAGLLFTFSCSQHVDMDLFKKIIYGAGKDSGRTIKIIHELSQGPDHPVSLYCPQSSYLKGLALMVE